MVTPIDLAAALDEYSPKLFEASVPAWVYEVSTPARRFTTVVGEIERGNRFVAIMARDFFDPRLARDLLDFAVARRKEWTVELDIQVLEGFQVRGYGFDSVAVLGPAAHELFVTDSRALNDRTAMFIPIFRPEFVGDETRDLIEVVRKNYVSTLDWKRAPAPRVYLKFNDTAAGVRSTGKKPGIERPEKVRRLIAQLTAAKGSFVEIQNYRGETRRIVVRGDAYVISDPNGGKPEQVGRAEIDPWLDAFLMQPSTGPVASPAHMATHTRRKKPAPTVMKMFLLDEEREREIASAEPMPVTLEQALDEFDRLSDTDGNFIGFIRANDEVLQFAWNDDGTLDLDIPVPERDGSLTRRTTFDECRDLIGQFAQGLAIESIPGLRFSRWSDAS